MNLWFWLFYRFLSQKPTHRWEPNTFSHRSQQNGSLSWSSFVRPNGFPHIWHFMFYFESWPSALTNVVYWYGSLGRFGSQDRWILHSLSESVFQRFCSGLQLWRCLLHCLWLLETNGGGGSYFQGFRRWNGNKWLPPNHCEYVYSTDKGSWWR